MKSITKNILKFLYNKLPWGGKEAINEASFEHKGNAGILSDVAKRYGIVSITVNGDYGLISGSPHDSAIMPIYAKTGIWSKNINDLFIKFFEKKAGGTYLDIGANIGLTTIPIAQNPNVACYCFEPEPRNYSNLEKNIHNNCSHQNVILKNMALFDKSSKLSFELSPINHGDHRIRLGSDIDAMDENSWKTIEIDAEPLDDIIQNIDGPLAVKMDTQGAEPFVIKGGQKLFSKVSLLIVEFSPYWMARMGSDPHILIDYIATFQHVKIADPKTSVGETFSGEEAQKKLAESVCTKTPITMEYWDVIAWYD